MTVTTEAASSIAAAVVTHQEFYDGLRKPRELTHDQGLPRLRTSGATYQCVERAARQCRMCAGVIDVSVPLSLAAVGVPRGYGGPHARHRHI